MIVLLYKEIYGICDCLCIKCIVRQLIFKYQWRGFQEIYFQLRNCWQVVVGCCRVWWFFLGICFWFLYRIVVFFRSMDFDNWLCGQFYSNVYFGSINFIISDKLNKKDIKQIKVNEICNLNVVGGMECSSDEF